MQNGLNLLQRELNIQALPSGHKNPKEGAVMPLYSFMIQLIAAFREYLAAQFHYTWAEYLICNKRHHTVHLVKSWVWHNRHSLEAQLLSSLLLANDIKKCKLYLRLRKYVLQLTNASMLDEIVLKHEDVITIVHRMFPGSLKKEIMNGAKQIFISYRVSDAKIYACVFIEYILSIYDSIDEAQQSFMVGETKSNVVLSNFSTISKFSSNLHKDNGLYRKLEANENSYTVIETKFLPQQLEKQQTKFQQDIHGNQYYSNSINFSSESSLPQHYEKENSQQSLNFSVQQREKASKAVGQSREQHQIKIQEEDEDEPSKRCFNESSRFSRRTISKEMQEVIIRNEAFKSRLLSGKTSVKMELSHEEEDSINQTINIIHSSIVRNRRQHI